MDFIDMYMKRPSVFSQILEEVLDEAKKAEIMARFYSDYLKVLEHGRNILDKEIEDARQKNKRNGRLFK